MKILTSRNGIALVAVLTILLVLTLLLPAMFTMSDTATKFSVEGEHRQRASYFARSICEMAVATYKNTYNVEVPNPIPADRAEYYERIKAYQGAYDKMFQEALKNPGVKSTPLTCENVYMYMNADGDIQYSNEYTTDGNNTALNPGGNEAFEQIGSGSCDISYMYQELYYLVDNDEKKNYEIKNKTTFEKIYGYVKNIEAHPNGALTDLNLVANIMGVEKESVPTNHSFTVTRVMNKIVSFDATAVVNNKVETRKCVIILPTYPSEQNWLLYPGATYGRGNEVVANPDKATGMTRINYNNSGIVGEYKNQNLLTFSCLGNMHISTKDLKCGEYKWVDASQSFDVDYVTSSGGYSDHPEEAKLATLPENATEFVMNTAPGVNTTPENDPQWNILDGINMKEYFNQTQADNFICMSSTNSITVDLPVSLIVNPARANRLGDGTDACYSLYKTLIFQAPTVVFGGQVDMLVSFYDRPANGLVDNVVGGDGLKTIDCRRMSSIVLSTPESGGYRYTPNYQEESVKAGRVVFLQDCYVWVIDYADNGSGYSEEWYEVAQTVYYKNRDLRKIKVASAGDVYLYNTELERTAKDGKKQAVGFSIAGYAIETIYYDKFAGGTNAPWYNIWLNAQQAIFDRYMGELAKSNTYQKDDFHLVANLYDGSGNPEYLELPDSDGIYTIWSS